MKLEKFIEKLNLEIILKGRDNTIVNSNKINRPGLQLSGYLKDFSNERIQVIGSTEVNYLNNIPKWNSLKRIKGYLSAGVKFVIFAKDTIISPEFIQVAKKNNCWVLASSETTTDLIVSINNYLSKKK